MQDEAKAGKMLGMAVKVASGRYNRPGVDIAYHWKYSVPIVSQIINSPGISSPNLPVAPGSLTTALHIASENGRADVGEFFTPVSKVQTFPIVQQANVDSSCSATAP